MTKWTIGTGAVVTVIGIVAYIASGASSLTALIPAALGILLVIAGLISRKRRRTGTRSMRRWQSRSSAWPARS